MSSNIDKIKELLANDKRKCDRLERPLKIRYARSSAKKDRFNQWSDFVWLDNIGGEGFGFSDRVELAKGEQLEIELQIPHEEKPMLFGAEVMWVSRNFRPEGETQYKDFSYGLKITRVDEGDYNKFVQFISDIILDEYLDDRGKLKDIEG